MYLTAHTIVKNEERWIWYAINSVIDYVDELLVWDTGSTDATVNIVRSISSPKIKFREFGQVNPQTFTQARQKMLDETHSDWLMLVDGDEIWPKHSIQTATTFIKASQGIESVVVRTNNLVGDIYHRLPQSSGLYHLAGRFGHLALRFINLNLIPDLKVGRPHGQQGFFDAHNRLIQNRDPAKIAYLDIPYHHATHLTRSELDLSVMKRNFKFKYELGEKIPPNEIPEIFFSSHPTIVPEVTQPAPLGFWLLSALATPFRRLRRQFFPRQSGY